MTYTSSWHTSVKVAALGAEPHQLGGAPGSAAGSGTWVCIELMGVAQLNIHLVQSCHEAQHAGLMHV